MNGPRFDHLVSGIAAPSTRRRVLGVLGISAFLAGGLQASSHDTEAGRRRRKKNKKGNKGKGGGGGTLLGLRDICTPGTSTCEQGLRCDSPTTHHSCSSTVEDVNAWCCVPPGGSCTECDCCGDYYCGSNANGDLACISNMKG